MQIYRENLYKYFPEKGDALEKPNKLNYFKFINEIESTEKNNYY